MNSWNGNTIEFGVPISIDSSGSGYWGSGTAILNSTGTGFYGSSEFHGIIALSGSFDSISFTHTSDYWHGFTVGVSGLADAGSGPNPIPEPSTMLLFGVGLAGLAGVRLRKKKQHFSKICNTKAGSEMTLFFLFQVQRSQWTCWLAEIKHGFSKIK